MKHLNRAQILGHLGRDPIENTLPSGDTVAALSVATTTVWKDRETGERKERTEWHRVVAFGPIAAFAAQYLRKGARVYIEGELRTREWQDRDGATRYTTEIVARDLIALDRKQDRVPIDPEHASGSPSDTPNGIRLDDLDEEIPF